ncbi:ion transporter [Ekhidna sp.]|uniref:ion transporter n=1 Tax=Ekhidna sp. TaxID=2608089 RepID=UPI003CCB76D2
MHFLTLSYTGTLRDRLKLFFESRQFHSIITAIIIVNSLLIGLETSNVVMFNYGYLIDLFDLVILVLFSLEIMLKIFVYKTGFFKDGWNLFDFLVIAVSLVPAAGSFSIFRALRIVRTLRLLKSIPKLRLIIESLVKSLPSIGWIVVLLSIVFYVYSVIGVNLFGEMYPRYFGDMGRAFYTLFQIMTLESWSSAIARPIMDGVPFTGIYFITFILIATYTTLNIFIAIVVNTMNEVSLENLQEEEQHIKDFVSEENRKLQKQLHAIQRKLDEMSRS